MGIYTCETCGELIDNDYHPGEPNGDGLDCPDCYNKREEQNEDNPDIVLD